MGNEQTYEQSFFVCRRPCDFIEVSGRLESFGQDGLDLKPVIMKNYLSEANPTYTGFKSGGRCGVFLINGTAIKAKGCCLPINAFERRSYNQTYGDDPYGGMTLGQAEIDIRFTLRYGEIMGEEGFPCPSTPVGLIHYNIGFFDPREDDVFDTQPKITTNNLVAPLIKILGDTRIPEIVTRDIKEQVLASDVTYRLGLMAGTQLKLVHRHNFIWGGGSSHVGNYVLFPYEGNINVGMVDFECSYKSRDRTAQQEDIQEVIESFDVFSYRKNGIIDFFRKNPETYKLFREHFIKGLVEGYSHPDVQSQVSLEEFVSSFQLRDN